MSPKLKVFISNALIEKSFYIENPIKSKRELIKALFE